jgi:hypothetical protein
MSQSELARLAFHALLTEVQRKVPSEIGAEYVLETSLVLRKSTALAPSRTSAHSLRTSATTGDTTVV